MKETRKNVWTLVYEMKKKEEFLTFKEAAERMIKRASADIQKGFTWQLLETSVWIEPPGGDMMPIMFYTVRDIAAENGWTDEWLGREKPRLLA